MLLLAERCRHAHLLHTLELLTIRSTAVNRDNTEHGQVVNRRRNKKTSALVQSAQGGATYDPDLYARWRILDSSRNVTSCDAFNLKLGSALRFNVFTSRRTRSNANQREFWHPIEKRSGQNVQPIIAGIASHCMPQPCEIDGGSESASSVRSFSGQRARGQEWPASMGVWLSRL